MQDYGDNIFNSHTFLGGNSWMLTHMYMAVEINYKPMYDTHLHPFPRHN